MFEQFFKTYPDYIIVEKPISDFIEKYKDELPNEVLSFWKEYGFGTFMNGYFRVIKPDDYIDLLSDTYEYAQKEIPIAVTAFGDIITWQGKAINMICYRFNYSQIIGADEFDWFMNMDLTSNMFKEEDLKSEQFEKAKEKLGELDIDECYGYVPLLALGGGEKVENTQKVTTKIHIDLITQVVGLVE